MKLDSKEKPTESDSLKVLTTDRELRDAWGNPEEMTQVQTKILSRKTLLNSWYKEIYSFMARNCFSKPPSLELGSGSSGLYKYVDPLIRSNILYVVENDVAFSAYDMPFKDASLGNIILINTFHHFGNPNKFFSEAERVLKPNGRILISDPYLSLLSFPVWKYLHPEMCDETQLGFDDTDKDNPLMDANSANATIMFCKEKNEFSERYNTLKVVEIKLHSKFGYWLAGGYNFPQLVPDFAIPLVTFFEWVLSPLNKLLASFMFVIIEKKE